MSSGTYHYITIITLMYSLKMFKNTSCSDLYNIFIFIEVSNNIRRSYFVIFSKLEEENLKKQILKLILPYP